ncbi:putative E3 ubiquitin-protein ligase UBR1 [Helianthus annuus]|nr:putative E3 ubiquitin-protein ligase UBR1 [Helianthus annuus]
MDLLTMLLECLSKIFVSCSGQDHQLQVSKWENLLETTQRVVEDIRFVMSQTTIPEYVTSSRRDICRTWVKLLAFVQGMNPQKRETNIHIEENENINLPFVLGHSIANIHALLVAGVFSTEDESVSTMNKPDIDELESLRHVKVGKLSQESSVSSVTARGTSFDSETKVVERDADSVSVSVSVLTSVSWLIFECLRSIEYWLKSKNASGGSLDYTNEFEVLSSADWSEIEYDVSSQDVSIHIPLHRFARIGFTTSVEELL